MTCLVGVSTVARNSSMFGMFERRSWKKIVFVRVSNCGGMPLFS